MTTIEQALAKLQKLAKAKNATVEHRGNGHFQIRGKLLVNYYPLSKASTAYVAGLNYSRARVDYEGAVDLAFRLPPVVAPHQKDQRNKNSRRERERLIARNGPWCHWCRGPLTVESSTVDHVLPIHRGGLENANNRVLACQKCNEERGNHMPELGFNEISKNT